MKKIAIINQRYGAEVNGGSESYTKLIAEHLRSYFDVTVLTTTAIDYDTWKNEYPAGPEKVNGVRVLRFPVRRERSMQIFRIVNKCTFALKKIHIHTDRMWVNAQGPETPQLIRYIKQHAAEYDVFIFVTYLYYTTVMGLPQVAEKAVLIPTAHDEPYIHLPIYRPLFQKAAGIIYLTQEEKEFVHQTFHNAYLPHTVIGIGIDLPVQFQKPETVRKAETQFRTKYQIRGEYMIYAGRVDLGKNCKEMFTFLKTYKRRHPDSHLQLVIVGKAAMPIPKCKAIRYLGYVSEEDKYAAIAAAKWLWLPSRFESLSIALLEGMALGTPGFVNGDCEVLKGHCMRSGAGVYYSGYEDFERKMEEISGYGDARYHQMSGKAREYVETNYQWDGVVEKFCRMFDGG